MAFSFSIYNHLHNLPEAWHHGLNAASPLQSSELGMMEKSNIANMKHYYVITYKDNEAVYFSYYQLLSVTPAHFNISHKKLQQAGLSCALLAVKPKLLIAGNLFRHDVLFFECKNPNASDEAIANYYQATTNHLISVTSASGIFLKDVDKRIAPLIIQDTSYQTQQDDVSMEINIPSHWHAFEDYENELKHKYLQRCRKIRKTFLQVSVQEFKEEDIKKYSKELEQLYLQVTKKQLVSMGIINHSFFEELKAALKDRYKVCGFFYEGKLVAFSSAILHDDEYDMNYIGFDYALNQSLNLYFNILFHCLESAILSKSKTLVLGRTAPEAKAILGCEPDYRFSFYKLRNPIVNWFYKMVASYFKESQGSAWKDRHPFKSSYYTREKN